jgi:hypothetical protein
METPIEYNSFNTDKNIDELLYNMNQYKLSLKNLYTELCFLKFLVEAKIFKPKVLNLFETLALYDKKISLATLEIEAYSDELRLHTNDIQNKIECDNLECDAFFINKQNSLEQKIYNFISEINHFKSEVFAYLKSVIKNT